MFDLTGMTALVTGASGGIGELLSGVDIGAEQRRHRADADGHRRLHRLPARLQKPRRGRKVERPRGTKRAIFAEAVTRDIIGLGGERHATFLFEHTQRCNRIRHDRGLGIFSEGQLVLGTVAHQLEKMLAECVVDLLKHTSRAMAEASASALPIPTDWLP